MKIDKAEAERRAKRVAIDLGASLPIANALWPLVADAILQARNDTAEECAKDTELLDWLESNHKIVRQIEPPDAFPSHKWIIFDDIDDEMAYSGNTFRDAVIEARAAYGIKGE